MAITLQIYTMQTVQEARALAAVGIERIGVTPAERGLPGEVSVEAAADIADAIRGSATVCALTVESSIDAIEQMVLQVRPDVLHLSGPSGAVSPEAVGELRARLPWVEIMQAIAVGDESAVDEALAYSNVADVILLDSVTPDVEGIGAAGVVHDWGVSRQIVERVPVPVILAGGLSPANVAEAIAVVDPWGVDSLTHTNRALPSGGFRKDLDLVVAFATAARSAR